MLSLILLSYNSSKNILKTFKEINKGLKKNNISYELIIVDDGSSDDSYKIACELEKKENVVSAFQLSKNYTSHYAIFAGLSLAKGRCAMPIPDDLQVPVDTIIKAYNEWKKKEKIVIPYREKRSGEMMIKIFSRFYYWMMNRFSNINFPKGGADIFLIDREIIDIINNHIRPKNTSSIVEILRLGFNPKYIPMSRPMSMNSKSRWTFTKKLKLASDTFFASSDFPIKIITLVGLMSFIFSLLVISFYIYAKIVGLVNVPGWTMLIIFISFFSGLILLSLGVTAEYIWRIYEEVKDRPGFIIKRKK